MSNTEIKIKELIREIIKNKNLEIEVDMPLIGDTSLLDSMKLVELCLLLEDYAEELSFEFDWTSSTALSKSRGMFRSIAALAGEFDMQRLNQK
jgi:acyl carrier protein